MSVSVRACEVSEGECERRGGERRGEEWWKQRAWLVPSAMM
jgi:hypothetical protein